MTLMRKLTIGSVAVMLLTGLAGFTAIDGIAQARGRPMPPTTQTPPAGRDNQLLMNMVPEEIPLWPNGAPGALGSADTDKPTLTIYRASRRANGTAVVVAPGGSYTNLAMDHEGRQVASFLNATGVTAFVLKYRLGPRYHHPIELGDAQRAIRIVRSRAQELGILPDRVGIMGFSAGGHLASTAATHFDAGKADAADAIDRVGCRPDFLILGYPVISTDPAIAHAGSVRNLLGENPDPKLLEDMSNDLRVTSATPPTFIFQTNADTTVVPENSVRFYLALRKANVPAEMHIFENGAHGLGLSLEDPALSLWPTLLTNWMRGRGLLTRP
jgi:acetyl esterase/lipase